MLEDKRTGETSGHSCPRLLVTPCEFPEPSALLLVGLSCGDVVKQETLLEPSSSPGTACVPSVVGSSQCGWLLCIVRSETHRQSC